LSAAGAVGLSLLFSLTVWAAWPFFEAHIFQGAYTHIQSVVVLWCLATSVSVVCKVFSTELTGFARFQELSLIRIASSIITLITLAVVVAVGSFQWSVAAILVGYLADFGLMIIVLSRIRAKGRTKLANEAIGASLGCGDT